MFKINIICINDAVDGITENKIYTATYVGWTDEVKYYGLMDDYGQYHLFLASRFITLTDDLINNIVEYKNGGKLNV